MGNSESIPLDDNYNNSKITPTIAAPMYYNDKYNLIPSFPGFEYKLLDLVTLKRKFNVDDAIPKYIDLRTEFPQILNMNTLPFNPVISVVYLLHYQLLRNNLPVFPPSTMYIYRNIRLYKNVKSLISLESVFNAIKEQGICSENEFPTNTDNLNTEINCKIIERANAFKFIEVYKIEQNLDTIKTLLNNKYPIIVGFTVYYDFSNVKSYMWMPDETIDRKLGGLSGVLVGYIEDRQMFIMAQTMGRNFGTSGYITIPYEYIINKNFTFELYTLDFIRERVEGYINQRKEIVNLEQNKEVKKETVKKFKKDDFGGLFK